MVSVTQREDSFLFSLHDYTIEEWDEMAYWLNDHVNSWQVAYEDGNAPLTVIVPDGSAALFKLRWCTASTQRPMGKTKTYQLPLTWKSARSSVRSNMATPPPMMVPSVYDWRKCWRSSPDNTTRKFAKRAPSSFGNVSTTGGTIWGPQGFRVLLPNGLARPKVKPTSAPTTRHEPHHPLRSATPMAGYRVGGSPPAPRVIGRRSI
jgi:hypothetical protein